MSEKLLKTDAIAAMVAETDVLIKRLVEILVVLTPMRVGMTGLMNVKHPMW